MTQSFDLPNSEPVSMYYYFNDRSQKIWTCNLSLAHARATIYNSDVYEVVVYL